MSDGATSDAEPVGAQGAMLRAVIAEFGRHLDMLAEQLGASLAEADREFVSVGESFHEMSAAKCAIEKLECAQPARAVLVTSCRQIEDSLHDAVVALRYHDRLAQRLGLVRVGLVRLQSLLQDPSPRPYDSWLASLREVERINRSEQLRLGPAVDEGGGAAGAPTASSVELF